MKKIMALSAAALMVLGLSACGGDPDKSASADQTVEQGCQVVGDKMSELNAKYADAQSEVGNDEGKAKEMLANMVSSMKSASSDITNTEVSEAWGKFIDAYSVLTEATSSDDMDKLTEAMTAITESGAGLEELCGQYISQSGE